MPHGVVFLRGSFLLFFTLGCFADEHEEKWTFTFPQSINTVKHSDVEIPCTFTAPVDSGEVRIVWFQYSAFSFPIVYSEDPSEVLKEYGGRTSLMSSGNNSCSLRITDVTYTARYYPGISTKINAFNLNWEKSKKAVYVRVRGCSETSSCKDWGFTFPRSIDVLRGSCVEIPCKLTYPDDAQNFTLFWYKKALTDYPKIFNSRTAADVGDKYKGRTSLVGNSMDTCSLRINNVQESEEIYPGINEDINSHDLQGTFCRVFLIDSPPDPIIKGTKGMKENEPVSITCAVNHTCASSPPSMTWNKPDLDVTMSHEDLDGGVWRITSTIKYIPSYRDDKTQLECNVTYPNNRTSSQSVTLDVRYKPQNVTISVVDNNQPEEGNKVTLQCTSQGNPPVTRYTWHKVGKTKTLTGTGVQITVENVTSEEYICSASNDMGTRESSVFSFITQSTYRLPLVTLAAILGSISLLFILWISFFCWRKKKCQKAQNHERDENPEATYTSLVKREDAGDYDTLHFGK